MARYRSKRIVLFDGTSNTSSTYTSSVHLVDDFEQLSIQLADTVNSTVTLQASFEDGLRVSLTTYSDVTGITAAGVYTIDTPIRWIRAQRNSADSLNQIFLQCRT